MRGVAPYARATPLRSPGSAAAGSAAQPRVSRPDAPRTGPLGCRVRPRLLLRAVRKGAPPASSDGGMDAAAVASWSRFAEAVVDDGRDPRSADGLSPEFRAAVNLMCNRSLKVRCVSTGTRVSSDTAHTQAMLAEDRAEVAELRREVSSLVQHFSEQDPPTARFLRVILSLLNSQLPADVDLRRLREDYALAFDSMWTLLEDAGWAVRRVRPGCALHGADACLRSALAGRGPVAAGGGQLRQLTPRRTE